MNATYLQLAVSQGGHRYGPFGAGAVYFGTDRSKCQIMLDTTSGLAPCHAVLTISATGQYSLSVTDRNNVVFVVQPGTQRAHQVIQPITVQSGATIYLGSLQGFQFSIQATAGAPAHAAPGSAARHPGQPGYGDAIGQEIQRRVETQLFTKVPAFRIFQEYWYKYKTGVLSQPRNVIALVFVGFGFLATLCLGCGTGIVALVSQILF